jgi:hypothetical protein
MRGAGVLIAVAWLSGCAATEPAARRADGVAPAPGASRGVPTARTADRQDPAFREPIEVRRPTVLSPVSASPRAKPAGDGEWQPEWFASGLTQVSGSQAACAAVDHADLLEARRGAIDSARGLLGGAGTIDRAVTRRLADGRFRVWVRVMEGG